MKDLKMQDWAKRRASIGEVMQAAGYHFINDVAGYGEHLLAYQARAYITRKE